MRRQVSKWGKFAKNQHRFSTALFNWPLLTSAYFMPLFDAQLARWFATLESSSGILRPSIEYHLGDDPYIKLLSGKTMELSSNSMSININNTLVTLMCRVYSELESSCYSRRMWIRNLTDFLIGSYRHFWQWLITNGIRYHHTLEAFISQA